jgi:hypothetical protein
MFKSKYTEEKFCKACNISSNIKSFSKIDGEYYCKKHAYQLTKYGKLIDTSQRTVQDINEIIEYPALGYAEIVLYNQDTSESGRAIIDIEDVEKCKKHKWRLTDKSTKRKNIKYVYAGSGAGNQLPLHRFITNTPEGIMPDHIDGNPLNNRKYNLRLVTEQLNCINKTMKDYHKLGFSGVYYYEGHNQPYKTEIQLFKQRVYFKNYKTLEDCALTRFLAEIMVFREYRSFQNDEKLFENTLLFDEKVILNRINYVCDKIKLKIIDFNIEESKKYCIEFLIKNKLIGVNNENVI